MQFMSQSTGWADLIILAMAPLGIITAIVGAIRVGGPTWLRAIIGRARESRAVVEAELMSSTSQEVCELWNGREIVRVMGAGPIREFIILLPGEDGKDREPVKEIQVKGLKDCKNEEQETEDYEAEDQYLKNTIVGMFKSILKKNSPRSGDPEVALHEAPNGINANVPNMGNDPGPGTKPDGRPVAAIRNLDAPAPSLTLNVQNQLSRGELYLVAALGTLLQFGVLVFSGCATYHPALRSRWLKVDNPAADYAFPCNAAGTLLLVTGVLICAHVVEGSTSETRYRPVEGLRVICCIPRQPQSLITTSQRWDVGGSKPILGEAVAVIGAMVSLCGFVAQFVGLRLHWSSSIAQLIAVSIMVGLRALVRRNLAQLPASRRLLSGHEMDWLAMTLADDDARASRLNPPKDDGDTRPGNDGDSPQNGGESNQQSRPWDWKPTAVEDPATLPAYQDANGSGN
ncbi:hypothetical protein CHGG_08881 [Chaetomium globosum CBS 148.51]|uniref:Uncharacterized protein n=1 Tax=Chaetomium globosum (strain ATCC 6205 / CBS 148.51 / DSM 1962 / NBRC 6347 / NRRL 1970) TaxID=306901 RepID=Q2GT23_CHAGB|nr:uncharacterized protein CHGG_08881 [Chaetomium globosum CBS 148.51]EAQ84867.1 hypothetical protein CHGG_08881 [Chaetomium globosum CBS 148.51]